MLFVPEPVSMLSSAEFQQQKRRLVFSVLYHETMTVHSFGYSVRPTTFFYFEAWIVYVVIHFHFLILFLLGYLNFSVRKSPFSELIRSKRNVIPFSVYKIRAKTSCNDIARCILQLDIDSCSSNFGSIYFTEIVDFNQCPIRNVHFHSSSNSILVPASISNSERLLLKSLQDSISEPVLCGKVPSDGARTHLAFLSIALILDR